MLRSACATAPGLPPPKGFLHDRTDNPPKDARPCPWAGRSCVGRGQRRAVAARGVHCGRGRARGVGGSRPSGVGEGGTGRCHRGEGQARGALHRSPGAASVSVWARQEACCSCRGRWRGASQRQRRERRSAASPQAQTGCCRALIGIRTSQADCAGKTRACIEAGTESPIQAEGQGRRRLSAAESGGEEPVIGPVETRARPGRRRRAGQRPAPRVEPRPIGGLEVPLLPLAYALNNTPDRP